MAECVLQHLRLGSIRGVAPRACPSLTQFLGIPYARLSRRWARPALLRDLPCSEDNVFPATKPGLTSVQPFGSVKTDARGNQLPTDGLPDDEPQGEDCLNLSITIPSKHVGDAANAGLPVVVFIHGGAFFLGSGTRPYYSPLTFCQQALQRRTPIVYVSINYRLGALGFFHCPEAAQLVPANNGLHDQLVALDWIKEFIGGFGGDADNVTVLGQSAGGESISLQSLNDGAGRPAYRRAIMFSGTPVTMPAKTPAQHGENFRQQAEKLGVPDEGKSMDEVAEAMLKVDVSKIRELAFVGAPCTRSELLPYEKPTMQLARAGKQRNPAWAEAQLISTTTYDGGISYNMMLDDETRQKHAEAIASIAHDVLSKPQAEELLDIYKIEANERDVSALQKVCLFESDIGFFAAAQSMAEGGRSGETYLQVFDLGNPFDGPLQAGKFATHTWDIVALLGAYEERLNAEYRTVVRAWRDKLLDFMVSGKALCAEWTRERGSALLVDSTGVRETIDEKYLDADSQRRRRLFALAEAIDGETGWDVLWEGVCRRFLMAGK